MAKRFSAFLMRQNEGSETDKEVHKFFSSKNLGPGDVMAPLDVVHPSYVVVMWLLSSHCNVTNVYIIMPAPTAGDEGMVFFGRPLTLISCDVISLYLVYRDFNETCHK